MRPDISRSTSNKNICHLARFPRTGRQYGWFRCGQKLACCEGEPRFMPEPRDKDTNSFAIQTETRIGSQRYVVQKVLMQSSSHCNIATSPQPRKPNHAIITATISTARAPIANFLLACADDNRDLLEGVCNSTRDFADRCRSFIRCYRSLISDK